MREPYFLETMLPVRVSKFMELNQRIGVEELTDLLIANFDDYKNKNKKKFIKSVAKAYQWQLHLQKKKAFEDTQEYLKNGQSSSPDIIEVPSNKINKSISFSSAKTSTPSKDTKEFTDLLYLQNQTSKSVKRKRSPNDADKASSVDLQVQSINQKQTKFESYIPEASCISMKGMHSLDKIASIITLGLTKCFTESEFLQPLVLVGPQGSGKTMFVTCLAGDSKATLIRVPVSSLSMSNGTEGKKLVGQIVQEAVAQSPCILLFEKMDSLSSKEYGITRGVDKKIGDLIYEAVTELRNKYETKPILVVVESENPRNIDPGLRSICCEIVMPVLDKEARIAVLKNICTKVSPNFDFDEIGLRTTSFVAGDLKFLVCESMKKAGIRTVEEALGKDAFLPENRRCIGEKFEGCGKKDEIELRLCDFLAALPSITPTLKQEGFPSIPETKWEDVGGLEDIKNDLILNVLNAMKYPKAYKKYKANIPYGILLWGPPGCGKTMLAKAMASYVGINFYAVNGPEFLSMYQGESERSLREVFRRAASVAPCIIFFDEIDGICPRKSGGVESGSKMTILNTLLVEMSGALERKNVYIIAATNRPDIIDPSLLRPERFDTIHYVGLPDHKSRVAILKACTENGTEPILAEDVDLEEIATWCEDFSGADCRHLLQMASSNAIREDFKAGVPMEEEEDNAGTGILYRRHFESAIKQTHPSVSNEERKKFLRLKTKFEKSMKEGMTFVLQDTEEARKDF